MPVGLVVSCQHLTGVNAPQSSGVTFGNVHTPPTRGGVAGAPGPDICGPHKGGNLG